MTKPIVVSVGHLTVAFGDFQAVKDVSFEITQGEIFGFLGANGAGKTTTIKVLCALERPTHGKVVICGLDLLHGSSERIHQIKSKVGYMSQKFTLYDDLSVSENLEFAAALRKIPRATLLQRKKELYAFIEFDQDEKSLVGNLSGGIKQQVSLVAALLHSPQIVFLDEPTAGVSPASRARFWNLIRDLSKNGTTVFVTTHYMDEAEQCERIALMRTGELIALDSPTNLKSSVFPTGLYEVAARDKKPIDFTKLKRLSPAYLEPYGFKAHIAFLGSTHASVGELQQALGNHFLVQQITPSLEDVFLHKVEGN